MSEREAASTRADLDTLEALQADASELERIENLLDRFNAFETVGFVNYELGHSDFLAFLLDPKRNGCLADRFIREVLRETLALAQESPRPPAFEGLDRVFENLDVIDLGHTLVGREHYAIDVLLENEDHELAVIIENKIGAPEGEGQLEKYDRYVRHIHPDWAVLKIYLTPTGADPTHEEYVPLSYRAVCAILDRILEDGGPTLDPDVRVPVEHFVAMVRRRILGDPEIVTLSQQLYERHKRAFDLIYQHRPDIAAQIREMVEGLVTREPVLALDRSHKDKIRFGVSEWDTPAQLTREDRTLSKHILLFEFWNDSLGLYLNLFMEPGAAETRQRLLEMVRAYPDVFREESVAGDRELIFHRTFLTKQQAYENLDREGREQEINKRWAEFLDKDLPRIEAAVKAERWIWESGEEPE